VPGERLKSHVEHERHETLVAVRFGRAGAAVAVGPSVLAYCAKRHGAFPQARTTEHVVALEDECFVTEQRRSS
jgi:translation initiation factor 2 gamma subunit (eIF-2gamma)